jgi:serine phosphatase RsbU (regulator of sigma subunit)
MFKYYLQLAFERKTFTRAVRVALLVGIILNLINTPQLFFDFSGSEINVSRVLLTFLVPFFVSTYSSVLSNSNLKPGTVSHIDALLQCKSCRKTDFHVHIGQEIEECPQCKKKTRWSLRRIFSKVNSNNESLKSLALFARHNPQPLFRIDADSIIIGANPASEQLFQTNRLIGNRLSDLVPELAEIDFAKFIQKQEVKEKMLQIGETYYNFVLKGVPVLESVHVYGNNITEIILAEQKIKRQAQEIQESIQYARRIQQAMLPGKDVVSGLFPEHFIFYRPRNTVSGDFYWLNRVNNCKVVAVADCTGHGVPGAFMSMMGISLLNEIVLRENVTSPAAILNTLRERLILALQASGQNTNVADGMDISVVVMNDKENSLKFSGAYNPLYIFREGELIIQEADRMPVGEHVNDKVPFTEKIFQPLKGDRLILFTDGYKDQNGGENNKKFSTRRFKELLTNSASNSLPEQKEILTENLDKWKNDQEQLDDVLVMGLNL